MEIAQGGSSKNSPTLTPRGNREIDGGKYLLESILYLMLVC